MEPKKQRIDWIDMLRGVAMIIVVIGHMNFTGNEKLYIYSFHMPLFFMISGITFGLSRKELPFKDFVIKKAYALLLPYFAWNIIALPYWYYNTRILKQSDTPLTTAIKGIFYCNESHCSGPTNATWFLVALFLVEIFFWLLLKLANGNMRYLTLAIGVCAVAGHLASYSKKLPPWHIEVVPTAAVFFFFGYIFMKYFTKLKEYVQSVKNYKIYYALAIPALLYLGRWFALRNVRCSMSTSTYGDFYYYYIGATATSIAIILLVLILPVVPPIKFIGTNTITYVALHCMILRTLENYNEATISFSHNHPYLTALVIILVLVPVCLVVNKFFPFLTGKKRRRNDK